MIQQQIQKRREDFNEWMKETVKSIYYSHNDKMCEAFERVE